MESEQNAAADLRVRWQSPDRTIYETNAGLEVVVEGDELRHQLARNIAKELADISSRATRLLVSFMREIGVFELLSVEVHPMKTEEGGDFSLRFGFVADRDPHEYNYTYFDVVFACHEPPQPRFWPFKFTVGFH